MNYILDTNVFINLVRNKKFIKQFNRTYRKSKNRLLTSTVVIGELESFSLQRKWGRTKKRTLASLLGNMIIYPIKTTQIINRYAEIDAYSQGKHPTLKLPTSSRNMGKNDLWIAATASVLNATLITTDKDFDHLDGVFLDLDLIDLEKIK